VISGIKATLHETFTQYKYLSSLQKKEFGKVKSSLDRLVIQIIKLRFENKLTSSLNERINTLKTNIFTNLINHESQSGYFCFHSKYHTLF